MPDASHTPGTRLSLGWADRTKDVASCPLLLCSLHESFHCDGAQNSHHESQLDLGSKPGSKGQERTLRLCFSKCINYLGQVLRNSCVSYFFLSSLEMVALSDLVGGKKGEGMKERGRKGC